MNFCHYFCVMKRVNFLTNIYYVDRVEESALSSMPHYLATARVFAANRYDECFVVDFHEGSIPFASEGMVNCCHMPLEEFALQPDKFFAEFIPADELRLFRQACRAFLTMVDTQPGDMKKRLTLSFDLHVKALTSTTMVNLQLTPYLLNAAGEVYLALVTMSTSARRTPGHAIINVDDCNYHYKLDRGTWEKSDNLQLNSREYEILTLTTQGYVVSEISEILHIDTETIKTHKRKLFKKMGVTNIMAAIAFATNYKLI